ncbi:MAG: hypothetical protein JWM90_1715 [Thermoleophilia bacterium]|nr:hypothetical protein [Thermoleophilia bacterium]
MPTFRRFPFLLALTGLLALLPATAPGYSVTKQSSAPDDNAVVMSPANESISTVRADGGAAIGPGSVVKRPIIIHNRSNETKGFSLDVAQVIGTSAETVAETRPGVREGAAAWVTLERTNFELKSDEQATIIATIKIPTQVTPGSKPFGVIATQTTSAQPTSGAGIAPRFTQTAIFIVEIPGDAKVAGSFVKADITSAQKSLAAGQDGKAPPRNSRVYVGPGLLGVHRLTLSAEYKNSGERLIAAAGTVTVKDIFGRTAGRYPIKPFRVYPGGSAASTVEMKGLPSLGFFRTSVELKAETGDQTKQLDSFLLVPKWFLIVLGLILGYLLWLVVRALLRRRSEWKGYVDESEFDEAEASELDESVDWDTDPVA